MATELIHRVPNLNNAARRTIIDLLIIRNDLLSLGQADRDAEGIDGITD